MLILGQVRISTLYGQKMGLAKLKLPAGARNRRNATVKTPKITTTSLSTQDPFFDKYFKMLTNRFKF